MKQLYYKHLSIGAALKIALLISCLHLIVWTFLTGLKLVRNEPPFSSFGFIANNNRELIVLTAKCMLVLVTSMFISFAASVPLLNVFLKRTHGARIAVVRGKYPRLGAHTKMTLLKEIYLAPIIFYLSSILFLVCYATLWILNFYSLAELNPIKYSLLLVLTAMFGGLGADAFSDWIRLFSGGITLYGEFEVRSERRLKPKRLRNAKLPTMDNIKKDSQT